LCAGVHWCSRPEEAQRPKIAILENVRGLAASLPKVLKILQAIGKGVYEIFYFFVDPKEYGCPMTRKRYYFVLVVKDMLEDSRSEAEIKVNSILKAMKCSSEWQLTELMFPDDHESVVNQNANLIIQTECTTKCKGCGGDVKHGAAKSLGEKPTPSTKCTWRRENWFYMKKMGIDAQSVAKTAKTIRVRTLRARHVIAIRIEQAKMRRQSLAAVEGSQNVERASIGKKVLPVITPGGIQYVPSQKRELTASEKLVLMGIPMFKIDVACNSERELSSLAGNAMHARAVGVALIIGMALVNREKFAKAVKELNKTSTKRKRDSRA
jgi:site-specific DNA-cytosine methylase